MKGPVMSRRNKLLRAFVLLVTAVMLLTACSANALETARSKKKKSTPTPVITLAPTAEPAQADETEAPAEPTAEPGPMEAAQELADYLGVERSGLSAEIGKLRREGVLESEKNRFTLLRSGNE